jgi:hypothetical protein
MLTLTQLNRDEFVVITDSHLAHGDKEAIMGYLIELGLSLDETLGLFLALLDDQVVDRELTLRQIS